MHALAAWSATVATVWALDLAGGDVADAWAAGLATTLAFGRAGCLFTGCCHGRAAARGVRYPWLPPWSAGPPWSQVRVMPLQLVELVGLAMLAIAGSAVTRAAPGWAASLVPAGYAVLRYRLELSRGDHDRSDRPPPPRAGRLRW